MSQPPSACCWAHPSGSRAASSSTSSRSGRRAAGSIVEVQQAEVPPRKGAPLNPGALQSSLGCLDRAMHDDGGWQGWFEGAAWGGGSWRRSNPSAATEKAGSPCHFPLPLPCPTPATMCLRAVFCLIVLLCWGTGRGLAQEQAPVQQLPAFSRIQASHPVRHRGAQGSRHALAAAAAALPAAQRLPPQLPSLHAPHLPPAPRRRACLSTCWCRPAAAAAACPPTACKLTPSRRSPPQSPAP